MVGTSFQSRQEDGASSYQHIGKTLVTVLSCVLLAIGGCGGQLIVRLYFLRGGKRIWLLTWLESSGWPIILIVLIISYLYRRETEGPSTKITFIKSPALIAAVFLGFLNFLIYYLNILGLSHIPVSTSALLGSTQIVFTALFAFLVVKQKFTKYSIVAVLMLTVGAAFLALDGSSDKPEGESNSQYILGLVMALASVTLSGLLGPLIEFVYQKAEQEVSYTVVMEMQLVIGIFSNVFATVGMLANNDFKGIPGEAREFGLGGAEYYIVLVSIVVMYQFYLFGVVGIIFSASSLLFGIICAILLPISEVLGVIFYHESFQAGKGISLILCLGGFVSHIYGEMKHNQKKSNSRNEDDESKILLHSDALNG